MPTDRRREGRSARSARSLLAMVIAITTVLAMVFTFRVAFGRTAGVHSDQLTRHQCGGAIDVQAHLRNVESAKPAPRCADAKRAPGAAPRTGHALFVATVPSVIPPVRHTGEGSANTWRTSGRPTRDRSHLMVFHN